jgi:hypothetical protein
MRRQLYFGLFSGVIALGLLNTSARAQSFPITGRIRSASTTLAKSSNATVFMTPATGHFILTQACGGGSMILSADTFGLIAAMTTDVLCYSFNPAGFALPQGEAIVCTNPLSVSTSWCSISGILEQ